MTDSEYNSDRMATPRDCLQVFFVIETLEVGGTEIHLTRIASGLARRGAIVSVYTLSGRGPLAQQLERDGAKVIYPPVRFNPFTSNLAKMPLIILATVKLFFIFLLQRPPIVHFFLPTAYIAGSITAYLAGLRGLIMSRRSLNLYQNKHSLVGRIERLLHPFMAAIIGNSAAVVEQLRNDEGVPADRLGLIYNGVPMNEPANFDRNKKRKQLGLGKDDFVIIMLANLIPYKGHADLIDALFTVHDSLPSNWTLLCAGRDDGIGTQLRYKVSKLGLNKNVRFLGSRKDSPELLRISDIVILPSHEEGFSNVVLEAMAAARPLVVTDVGGNAEAVADGKTGIVIPARDTARLSRAILRLARDSALSKRMGAAGRKRAETLFAMDVCLDHYESLYASVLAGTPLPKTIR